MNSWRKAFTLAEIFITMVVLSVLVSVCLAFFAKRHDYPREYYYYSAYRNMQNVVNSALFKNEYVSATNERVVTTECGETLTATKCRAFKDTVTQTTNLCSIFNEYFNTVSDSCGSTFASVASFSDTPSLKLTNGMTFYFNGITPATIADLNVGTLENTETNGYTLWVDINGRGNGEDKENYDILKFYITLSGKVIPAYGAVSGIRGYEFTPSALDAAGNSSLMAFDVVYKDTTATEQNYLTVLDTARAVSFVEAACKSGYVHESTRYCQNGARDAAGTVQAITKDGTCDSAADCKIRLVKKLKRNK